MFEKIMKMAYLIDVYGGLIDEHTLAIMRAYYEDDLSLSEIAAGEGISRQGVRHIIKKCEDMLEIYEEKLSLGRLLSAIEDARTSLADIARRIDDRGDARLSEISEEISQAIRSLGER